MRAITLRRVRWRNQGSETAGICAGSDFGAGVRSFARSYGMSAYGTQTGGWKMGRACPLCPSTSDINMFCYCQSVINFDAEISDRAFDLGVAKQKLDSPEIAGAPVNQASLRASERMRSEKSWVQPNVSIGVEI